MFLNSSTAPSATLPTGTEHNIMALRIVYRHSAMIMCIMAVRMLYRCSAMIVMMIVTGHLASFGIACTTRYST